MLLLEKEFDQTQAFNLIHDIESFFHDFYTDKQIREAAPLEFNDTFLSIAKNQIAQYSGTVNLNSSTLSVKEVQDKVMYRNLDLIIQRNERVTNSIK